MFSHRAIWFVGEADTAMLILGELPDNATTDIENLYVHQGPEYLTTIRDVDFH